MMSVCPAPDLFLVRLRFLAAIWGQDQPGNLSNARSQDDIRLGTALRAIHNRQCTTDEFQSSFTWGSRFDDFADDFAGAGGVVGQDIELRAGSLLVQTAVDAVFV